MLEVNNGCSLVKNKGNNYSDLPSYVMVIHVNAHLNSLQSMMIKTRNKSTKKTAVHDSVEHLEITMDGCILGYG